MHYLLYGLAALAGSFLLMFFALLFLVPLLSRSGFAAGRWGRLFRIGRMSARLSTSFFGAQVRRLFAGKAKRARIDESRRKAEAAVVADTMGHMKGAFMKLGQMMSFVSDDLPEEYRTALAALRASAPPMDFALIRDVAERELGKPLERAFARFDEKPIAAASIGQVHRAQLPSGEEVAVKIQYPGVAEAIKSDLDNVAVLYSMMAVFYPGMDPKPVVAELRSRIFEELDYRREARNQLAFYDLYEDHPFIRIPKVFDAQSTSRVLVTEFIEGRSFEEVLSDPEPARSRYGEILSRFVFGSILRFGVFNGDPHPGNYLFDADGKMVFLDFGCVKYFPEEMLASWTALVGAHLAGDRAGFRSRAVALGFLKADSPIDQDLLYDYFHYFYEPFHDDAPFAFTREYNGQSLKRVFAPEGRFAGLEKKLNMPADFVFVNRIQWGIYSIFAQLGATGNWHRIDKEQRYGAPPSTELGRIDAEYRARWLEKHQLAGHFFAFADDRLKSRKVA